MIANTTLGNSFELTDGATLPDACYLCETATTMVMIRVCRRTITMITVMAN